MEIILKMIVKLFAKFLPVLIRWRFNEKRIDLGIRFDVGRGGIKLINGCSAISAHFEFNNHLPFSVMVDRCVVKFNLTGYVEEAAVLIPFELKENDSTYFPLNVCVSERNQKQLNEKKIDRGHVGVDFYIKSNLRNIVIHRNFDSVDIRQS